jgi:nitrite reductase (NO-forming)
MAASRTLPVPQQALGEGACCGACAAETGRAAAADVAATTAARPVISRDADRRITFGGMVVSAVLLALAAGSLALPAADRHGLWLPLHLLLAGTAGTAIASVLPFFSAAIAVARPVRPAIRTAAIGLIAGGALVVSLAVVRGSTGIAVAGGIAYLAGLAIVAVAAFTPLRGALVPRGRFIGGAYAVAIAEVATGVALATAMLAGLAPVVERWALLKPAHAWLNVFGFLSIVVATSLVHLAPTVAGSRIRFRPSAAIAVLGLAAGTPLVALGLALASDPLARLGAIVELLGAVAIVGHALAVHRDRGRWTTDPEWHRFTSWSLTVAPWWFLLASGIAAGRVLSYGASPASWSIELLAAPLALGWLVQVLLGSWTHLVPAIGPGDRAQHARDRVVLGRWAAPRVVALNAGTGAITLGVATGTGLAFAAGAALSGAAVAGALVLLVVAAVRRGVPRRV